MSVLFQQHRQTAQHTPFNQNGGLSWPEQPPAQKRHLFINSLLLHLCSSSLQTLRCNLVPIRGLLPSLNPATPEGTQFQSRTTMSATIVFIFIYLHLFAIICKHLQSSATICKLKLPMTKLLMTCPWPRQGGDPRARVDGFGWGW